MNKLFISILVVSLACLFPFLVLSFYNQPVGDDYWYTWMAKQNGFAEAQRQWFITINGRYSSNVVMSLNSLCYGSVISYKIWPMLAIAGFIVAIYRLLDFGFQNNLARWQKLSIAVFTTSVFYINMPGIHEGGYWMSSLTGYAFPVISFLLLLPLAAKYRIRNWLQGILLFIAVIVAAGFHELIALMAAMVAFYLAAHIWCEKRKIATGYIILAVAAGLSVLIQVLSVGNRYKADITLARKEWSLPECIAKGFLQTCYHIFTKGILSPTFWLAAGLYVFIGFFFNNSLQKRFQVGSKRSIWGFATLALCMVFFPGILLVYIENNYAAMRIMNLSYFIFITAFFIAALFGGMAIANNKKASERFEKVLLYKYWFAGLLALLSIVFSGNEKLVISILMDGSAKRYSQQMDHRFEVIKSCQSETCPLVCITDQPLILCPVDACQDSIFTSYLEKVFAKKLLTNTTK